jgi:hypothetical protein
MLRELLILSHPHGAVMPIPCSRTSSVALTLPEIAALTIVTLSHLTQFGLVLGAYAVAMTKCGNALVVGAGRTVRTLAQRLGW